MKREIHNFIQGSPEWLAYRATPNQFNASDAPAMLGESPYKSRDQLLKELATGITQEVGAATQHIFNEGHRFESEDRPRAEEFIGQELYPATVSVDLGEIKLSASLDGWTMCEEIIYEHKTKNKTIIEHAARNEIALVHRIQMEQQFICSGATKCLFTGSLGAADNEPVRIWYESDPALRERVIEGWKQLAIDLANYVMPEAEAPKAIAEPVATLPSISFKTEFAGNRLVLTSNLAQYKAAASKLVEQSKEVLATDQDFANAEARIKSCKDAEDRIAHIQKQVLGEVADIEQFTSELGAISEMLRQCRLNEDKQVKARKEQIRLEIINDVRAKMQEHINVINDAIFKANVSFPAVYLPVINVDFLSAIKGKKTVKSLTESANDELARGKIEANRIAGIIDANLEMLNMIAVGYDGLFADIQQLVLKDKEALNAIAQQRINAHKEEEQKKIQAEARRIADEQIERDRQAEAQRVADLAKQNEVVAPVVQAQAEPAAARTTNFATSSSHRPAAAQASIGGMSATSAIVDEQPAQAVQHNDYQRGIIYGLELALRIHASCARNGSDFIDAINAVCTSDNIPAAPISKAA
jgi:predicted phage-related endonuclease